MTNAFQKFAVTSASAVFSFAALNANLTQAATVTYDFDVSVDSGPLLNETYMGSLSFDDSALSGSGSELLSLSDLTFNFLGIDYTEADDPNADVEFLDGNFLGLSFSLNPTFSFVPGFSDVSEALFTYDIAQGAGAGDATYNLRTGQTSVPEPASGIGLLTLTILGTVSRLKHKQ
jgi:hypothetical protein